MIYRLRDTCYYSKDKVSLSSLDTSNYITTDNLIAGKKGKTDAVGLPPKQATVTKYVVNDILISNIRPYLKKIWLANCTGGNSADVLTLKTKKGFDPVFIYYALCRDDFFRHMMNGSKGVKMPRGDKEQIMDFIIPDFTLPTQKKIAKVLSDLDAKIELNNKINAELEAMAKTIYDYWFVQFDFPNEEGKPYKSSGGAMTYNPELKREIPEGWEVKELGEEIEVQRGISYKSAEINGDGVPMINLNSFNLDGTYKESGIKMYSGKYAEKNLALGGDLLIAVTDVTRNADIIGKSIIVPSYYDALVYSMDIARIIPKGNITESYLKMLFNSKHYHNHIKWFASGTIVLHLNMDGMKWYKLELPPKDILDKYNTLYKSLAERISETTKQNQKLEELRDWLLPMLMNGQVSVADNN